MLLLPHELAHVRQQGSGRSDAFLLRQKILELQRLIATRQTELQKLTRFPRGDSAKIAALKEEIAGKTRQLQVLQRDLIAAQRAESPAL
jgi:hypothetical protein